MKHNKVNKGSCPTCRSVLQHKPIKLYLTMEDISHSQQSQSQSQTQPQPQPQPQPQHKREYENTISLDSDSSDQETEEEENVVHHLQGLLEFQIGRNGDLEGQIEELEDMQTNVLRENGLLKRELCELKDVSNNLKEQIKRSDHSFQQQKSRFEAIESRLRTKQISLEQDFKEKAVEVECLKEELKGFSLLKNAAEVMRLTTEIDSMQRASYYQSLRDGPVDKNDVIQLLAGFHIKNDKICDELEELKKKLKSKEIQLEKFEKSLRHDRKRAKETIQIVEQEEYEGFLNENENNDDEYEVNIYNHYHNNLKSLVKKPLPPIPTSTPSFQASTSTMNVPKPKLNFIRRKDSSDKVQNGKGSTSKKYTFPDGKTFML